MTLDVWRYPIEHVYVTGTASPLNGPKRVVGWTWHAVELVDHFPTDEPLADLFTFGASDYDMGDDEMYCPCGATVPAEQTLGERLAAAEQHVRERHPEVKR